MKYSESTGGFYDEDTHYPQGIPEDAVELSTDQYEELLGAQSSGKVIKFVGGVPCAEYPPPVPKADLLEAVKNELRAVRAPMLDALAGIAGRADRAGNTVIAAEADALAQQLLDITDYPVLNAATTLDDMRAAGLDAYRRMASTASADLASVFKEITGA